MKRCWLVFCMCALPVFALGCQNDPRTATISKIIKEVNQASTNLSGIDKELKKAIKEAEKENKKINKDNLTSTLAKIEKLRLVGGNLATLKATADTYQSKIKPAQQKAFAEQKAKQLSNALTRLAREQEKLRQTRSRLAERANQKALALFDDALQTAMQEFESITRQ